MEFSFEKDVLAICNAEQLGFQDNELAYLALTSKPEHCIRDRIAFALQRRWEDGKCSGGTGQRLVAREWSKRGAYNRADLALFCRGAETPDVILEFKALACPQTISGHKDEILADLTKLSQAKYARKYFVLCSTWVDAKPLETFREAIKYWKTIETEEKVRAVALAGMQFLRDAAPIEINPIKINAGTFAGAKVTVELFSFEIKG